jgi:hypothetical protein
MDGSTGAISAARVLGIKHNSQICFSHQVFERFYPGPAFAYYTQLLPTTLFFNLFYLGHSCTLYFHRTVDRSASSVAPGSLSLGLSLSMAILA